MRPLELRLRNFRSFYGESHRFDFRDRRLIGIVGPIGSGKSTILDAIAFALYRRTPRIGRATRSLIHQRADNAAVALRFEVEGGVWEAVRNLRRSGASQHALYRMPDDTPDTQPDEKVTLERDVNEKIQNLLGLDFHGFGRSVLLAQGRFAQFLGARPAERDKVLKGVFGYERVGDIRERARDALRRAEHELEILKVRIDHAEEAKARLDRRRDELAETGRRLETLEAARPLFEEVYRRVSRAEEGRQHAEARLAELDGRCGELPDQIRGERVLEKAEQAGERRNAAEQELGAATDRLEKEEEVLNSEECRLAVQNLDSTARMLVRLEATRDRIETRLSDLRKTEEELPDLIRGQDTAAASEQARARGAEARREWEEATARFADVEARVTSEDFNSRRQRAHRAGGLLIQLRTRRETAERAAREAVRLGKTLEEHEASEQSARSTLARAISERRVAEDEAGHAGAHLQEAEDRLQDARHADMAGTLRDRLVSGEQCPVCDRPVHRVPSGIKGDTSAAEEAVHRARLDRKSSEERLRKAIGDEQAAKAERDATANRIAEFRDYLQAAQENRNRQVTQVGQCLAELAGLVGEGDPAVLLKEEQAAIEAIEVAAVTARREREVKRSGLDRAIEEERRYESALSDLRARIGTLGAKLEPDFDAPDAEPDAVRAGLASLHEGWLRTIEHLEGTLRAEQQEIKVVSAQQAKAQTRVEAFRRAVTEARSARDRALQARDEAVSLEQEAGNALSDLRARVGRLGAFLDPDFQVLQGDPDAVRTGLASLHAGWQSAMSDLRCAVDEYRTEREAATYRLEKEQTRYGITGSIEEALAEVRARFDQMENLIERDEQQVAAAGELRSDSRRWRKEVNLHRRLVHDLTDSRFIRFLLDEERATLAGLGSEHFERLSSRRYRFTEDGKFDVVDLNSAEATRRADSLSGGETFLASLALALGLAEMVGRRGGRLDAFFLDEGFGTLDPEHLDLAMGGIESLVANREQRLVVVVSHVPELRERIEDLLELDKNPVTGDSEVVHGEA